VLLKLIDDPSSPPLTFFEVIFMNKDHDHDHDYDHCQNFKGVKCFLNLLLTKFESYQLLQDKLTREDYFQIGRNPLIFHLKCLPTYLQELDKLDLDKSPEIQAFLACAEANPIPDLGLFELICRCPQPSKNNMTIELEGMRLFVSQFLADLHHRLHSTSEMRKPTACLEQDVIRPITTMSACVDKMFEEKNHYAVVRVNLSYSKAQDKPHDIHLEFDRLKLHWSRLYGKMCRNVLFKGLEGYIYKIDHTLDKGLCIKALFFFDAMEYYLDEDLLAREIGQYWNFDIARYGKSD
jgi:hypothetical protein